MALTIKTAVSVHRDLLVQGEALAQEMHISRSRLFALALEEFIRRHENQRLLDQINDACSPETPEEKRVRRRMRRWHLRLAQEKP
ncbi:MAG: hypothetical protein HYR60_32985 [Acidobacteria bacterium]|nr:hypothetical protein [Acidobacteriota bacterium]MBI3473609.1 hypothetical protein [Candidatus Solibacter usitatus]